MVALYDIYYDTCALYYWYGVSLGHNLWVLSHLSALQLQQLHIYTIERMFVYICTNSAAALILSGNKDNNLYAIVNINEIMIFF